MFLHYGIDMRLVVFFNGFNLWLSGVVAIIKHATNANHTITERYAHAIKRLDKNNEK
ncbi:hypothetical protein [Helicobacter pylori]|uniref:hypothetical protein n=1 Tax=Helicobacter pylori TaxID=210 RepID=UPI001C7D264D|nr:hypothetical protein [Helicobacter pylori]